MVLILKKIWDSFKYALDEYSHPRTKDWLLTNPLSILLILVIWLYFCLFAGPRFMKKRKPYELKNILIVYNLVQVILSCFLFYEGGVYVYFGHYNFYCQPVDYTDNPIEDYVATLVWWYLFCKLTELLDTVFFVLRKKDKQITTLHVFHHTIMPVAGWIAVTFMPGGHGSLVGWVNTFVHIIMYSYYLVAGLGPQFKKYLWWKKHLTALQLIQFCIIFWHNFQVLFRDCSYPRAYNYLILGESIVFIYMFGSFYYKSYVRSKNKLQ